YGQDAEVARYMSWTPHESIDDTLAFLRRIVDANIAGHSLGYLIFDHESEQLLGSIGGAIEGHRMQFGYLLARDVWGRGLACEAVGAFIPNAFCIPAVERIQAFCEVNNRRSARVLEKSGFSLEGTLRRYLKMPNLGPAPRDVLLYALVRE